MKNHNGDIIAIMHFFYIPFTKYLPPISRLHTNAKPNRTKCGKIYNYASINTFFCTICKLYLVDFCQICTTIANHNNIFYLSLPFDVLGRRPFWRALLLRDSFRCSCDSSEQLSLVPKPLPDGFAIRSPSTLVKARFDDAILFASHARKITTDD